MINDRNKSLKKLYGWMIKKLEDSSKKNNQPQKNYYGNTDDTIIVPNNSTQSHFITRSHSDSVQQGHSIVKSRVHYPEQSHKNGNRESRVMISYHKPKPKKKFFFGSKTGSKTSQSRASKNKYYGRDDDNYQTETNIKKMLDMQKEKNKILKN